ncbi:MAG: hypothetical protein AB4352_24380 [Hormoscilla sp.]
MKKETRFLVPGVDAIAPLPRETGFLGYPLIKTQSFNNKPGFWSLGWVRSRTQNVGVRHPQIIGKDEQCLYRRTPAPWGCKFRCDRPLVVGAIAPTDLCPYLLLPT